MENLDGGCENEEDFHSASDSPVSNGDLKPASDFVLQLVIACTALYQLSKLRKPYFPVGLPPLPLTRKGHSVHYPQQRRIGDPQQSPAKTNFPNKNVLSLPARRSKQPCAVIDYKNPSYEAGSEEQAWNTLDIENLSSPRRSLGRSHQLNLSNVSPLPRKMSEQPGVKSCASSAPSIGSVPHNGSSVLKSPIQERLPESPPHLRKRSKAPSMEDHSFDVLTLYGEEGFVDKDLERMSAKAIRLESLVKVQPGILQDGESCVSKVSEDGEVPSCALDQNLVDMNVTSGEDCFVGHGLRENVGSDLSRLQDVSDRYSKTRSMLLDSIGESSFSGRGTGVKRTFPSRPIQAQCQLDQRHSRSLTHPDETDERMMHIEETYESNDALNESQVSRSLPTKHPLEGSTVYKIPREGQSDSLLLWPVGFAVEIISFQVRLIVHVFSVVAMVFNWCNSFASSRVRETIEAKDRATEALSHKVAMITNVPPKVTESGSMVLKRAAWGCLAAVYVCIFLSMLLFPALLLDYVFLSRIVEEPVRIKEPLHFDYTLPHPTAVIFVHPLGVHGSMGTLASHLDSARPISISHKLLVTVILTLPESDYNRNLGMFQLTGELVSENDRVIKLSSRPCMLRFQSAPIRMIKTFLVGLPALVGMFTESQTLVIPLLEFEGKQVPVKAVRIVLQPKAGMPVGQGIPEIYTAEVVIESHLPWLKELMRNWKWTIYIWTGLMLYLLEIIMVLCCCRQALVPTTWVSQIEMVKAEQPDGGRCEMDNSLRSQMLRKHASSSLLASFDEIPTARVLREHKRRHGQASYGTDEAS